MAATNPPFMTGVPELLCLRLLADEEMYGYELVRRIRLVTEEAVTLGEGVVYPTLHMLEKRRELKARREIVSGRPRIYYSVSAKGRRRLQQLEARWSSVRDGVERALGGATHVE